MLIPLRLLLRAIFILTPRGNRGGCVSGRRNRPATQILVGSVSMLVTTMDNVAGKAIGDTLGLVRGKAFWSRRVNKICVDGSRHLQVNGVEDMDLALDEARERATETVRRNAQVIGADAVIGLRIEIAELSAGTFMVLVWGTAVTTVTIPLGEISMEETLDEASEPVHACRAGRASSEGSSLRH